VKERTVQVFWDNGVHQFPRFQIKGGALAQHACIRPRINKPGLEEVPNAEQLASPGGVRFTNRLPAVQLAAITRRGPEGGKVSPTFERHA
jgi:hypothetical protein